MRIKFVLRTGSVMSCSDRQIHTVQASRLVNLYGLNPKDCLLDPSERQLRGYHEEELVHLCPLDSGEYRIKLYSEIKKARTNWLVENDSGDGTDCVTPYDYLLYGFNSVNNDNT